MGDEWLSETKVFFVVNYKYSGGQNMRKRESDEWLSETKVMKSNVSIMLESAGQNMRE